MTTLSLFPNTSQRYRAGSLPPERIDEVEAALGVRLPTAYRNLLAAYPFPAGSLADECLVLHDAEALIALNRACRESLRRVGIDEPFAIGSDGGAEVYFVDLAVPTCPVHAFDTETWTARLLSLDLRAWCADVGRDLEVIARVEAAEARPEPRRPVRFW